MNRDSNISVNFLCRRIGRFLADEDGPTAVEYAVMLAMIILACLAAVILVGQSTSESYTNSATSIGKAMGGK
ncbi:MAG: Flp family type IVb pilin [Planctomycetes bacterium]|nr:Flp family type IVb pilin [Planctomycetota bacterium]